jgi:hypothetical protein
MSRATFCASKTIFRVVLPKSSFQASQRQASSYEDRRVVITGLGGVTPLGVNIPTSWQGLVDGHCAIRRIEEEAGEDEAQFLPIYKALPSKIAARYLFLCLRCGGNVFG